MHRPRLSVLRAAGAFLSFLPLLPSNTFCAAREIPAAYLEISDCPDHRGCPALILLDETEFNYDLRRPLYTRTQWIKFFTQEGVQNYSDVSAEERKDGWDVKRMRGRTLLPDGSERYLEDRNLTIQSLRRGKGKYRVKSGSLPGVVPGAVAEWSYQYEMEVENFKRFDAWVIQQDLPVLKTRYVLKGASRGWVQTGMTTVEVKVETPVPGTHVFTARNVPPLVPEPLSPDPEAARARILFFPPGVQKNWLEYFAGWHGWRLAHFLEESPRVRETLERIVAASDPDAAKARKIYDFVQREIGDTEARLEEAGETDPEEAENAEVMLSRGYGTEMERTLLFLALATAAGLEPGLLLIANRSHGPFDERIPDPAAFDSFAASVKLGGHWKTLDPATKFCPFGRVSPEKESDTKNGILVLPEKSAGFEWSRKPFDRYDLTFKTAPHFFVAIPASPAAHNELSREAAVDVAADGSAEIEIVQTGTGHVDLSLRQAFSDLDDAERREWFQWYLGELVPGADLLEFSVQDLSSFEKPATLRARFRVPGVATLLGDRLVLSPSLLHAEAVNPFAGEHRSLPVHFPYAHTARERILVRIPEGFTIGDLPDAVALNDPPFSLTLSFFETPEGLRVFRQSAVDAATFPVKDFERLRSFFARVQEADRQAVILSKPSP